MERCLQMTFVPQIEKGWNFFVWVTDENGQSLPLPKIENEAASLPSWLGPQSPYRMMPTSAAFITDSSDKKVDGWIMTLASGYQMLQERFQTEVASELIAGETLRWFGQIAASLEIILADGHFYPLLYHLERGNHEWCVFCQWMPDARSFAASRLFSDWLSRLPELAFAIADLQDERVRQWFYLVIIYWTNALIHQILPDPATNYLPQHSETLFAEGQPFGHDESPWLTTHDASLIRQIEQLEGEWADWLKPIITSDSEPWIEALTTFKKNQLNNRFIPDRAQLVLSPEDEEDPFSPAASWLFDVQISGWQGDRLLLRPLKELQRSALLGRDRWFDEQLATLEDVLSPALLKKIAAKTEGRFSAAELGEIFQLSDKLADQSIDLIFPENLRIEGNAEPISLELDLTPISTESSSLFSLNSLINYNWRIAIGDIPLSADVFRQLVRENQSFIRYKNKWIHLPMQEMRKAYDEMDQAMDYLDHKPSIAGSLKLEAVQRRKRKSRLSVQLAPELADYLGQLIKKPVKKPMLPPTFQGDLRAYQFRGFAWIVNLRNCHVGGCLADDMGLGKTVQAIAYLAYCKEHPSSQIPADFTNGPALIICPTSLVANWRQEFSNFAPDLSVYIHHGTGRLHGAALHDRLIASDVMVTSYNLFTKESEQLKPIFWQSVILDEAQAIKNPQAQKTRALRKISCAHRLVLTGTPIENHLEELWSIIEFLNPGYLGSLERFRRRFIQPIEKKNSRIKTRELTTLIQPFLLRREKTDKKIIQDLPDKFEEKKVCFLTKEQASLYQSIVNRLAESVGLAAGIRRKGLILSTLTKLKQVCDHPALVGSPEADANASGKMELFYQLLDPLFARNQKVLVFTQYVRMGKLLAEETANRYPDADVFFLHGSLSGEQREQIINKFQTAGARQTLFVLSLKAGGVGINLTEAGYVIHYDRWWNPAVEEQATDRAYRIGQTKNIYVYKLICEGTLEERIDQLIERKKNLQKQILGHGDAWLTEMTDQEIFQLIQLREGAI